MVDQHGNHTASLFFGRTLWHWECMTAVPEMSGIQRGWRIPRVALAVLAGEAPTLWSVGTSFGKQSQFLFQNKCHKCCIWLISSRRLALHHLSISHAKLHRPCLGCRWKFLQGHKPSLPPSINTPKRTPSLAMFSIRSVHYRGLIYGFFSMGRDMEGLLGDHLTNGQRAKVAASCQPTASSIARASSH